MAGGNETPRQKMIGMMYLVLTALLALNVSTAVLEKFSIIDKTLSDLIVEDTKANTAKYKGIVNAEVTGAAQDDGKQRAKQVIDLTESTLKALDDVKERLKHEPGPGGKLGNLILPKDLVLNTNNAEELMLNEREPELGKNYEKLLVTYQQQLNKITKPLFVKSKYEFPPLTKTAADYESMKEGQQVGKPFLIFAFHGVPTQAAIATISQVQSEILDYEKAALDTILGIVKGEVYEVDALVPMVQAESNTIVAGTSYEGKLFVAGAATGAKPEMYFGGNKIAIDEEDIGGGKIIKMGKIKFPVKASGLKFNEKGVAEASFNVKIILGGKNKDLDQTVKYKVLKPVATFTSATTNNLYLGCGNKVNVSIQGLNDLSALNLVLPDVSQGSIIRTSIPGQFVILPSRPECKVRVTIDGAEIDLKTFKAVPVPTPLPRVQEGNTVYDPSKGVSASGTISVFCDLSDPNFASTNPEDANYQVASFVLKVRGAPIAKTGNQANLSGYNLKSGDYVEITNVKVLRTTYDKRTVDVPSNRMDKSVRIR